MEEIEPDIDPEERIGNSEGPAVTKAEVGIPLGVETNRKEQGDGSAGQDNGQLQKPGRKIDTGLRDWTVLAQSGAVSNSLTEIDPQVQKGEDESRTKHRPLNRQKRPEDAGVVELPHPQPFL
jgi:hypothetical protein